MLSNEISFTPEGIDYTLKNKDQLILWISEVITAEDKELGELSYIFCSDEYLHKMNLEYLNHDTFTDIITFNYCEDDLISGDIFISMDRVEENAKEYGVTFNEELKRVIVHGVLHLVGYNDKSDQEQEEMTAKEDFYLSLYSN
jgi:probable rRNA maturation factor